VKRPITSLILALAATLALASAALANPISEPASCTGYLSSYANPNNGWIMQNLVFPWAEEQDTTVGDIVTDSAHLHLGGLEPCIPE
jgi:hypothetical protein